MSDTTTPIRKEQSNGSSSENQKGIENHKNAAKHHEEAAKFHIEAAKHHEDGNHEKACESAVKANGHSCLAGEHQREDAKHHAIQN